MIKKIQAVVFDMDGILIDSEHLWRKAEIAVFENYGIHLTDDDCKKLMGIRTDEVVKQIIADFGGKDLPASIISNEIVNSVCGFILTEGRVIQDFCDLAIQLKKQNVPLAVATSSPMQVVDSVLKKTGLEHVFEVVVSAEKLPFGKPHPQVYIEACLALGKNPVDCLAIEDSLNGTLAGKAARMRVIAIPEEGARGNKGFGIADFVVERAGEAGAIIQSLI
jgi:beta-phosphoglucomutase-like phosphatase (HAD superfamily)